MNSGFFLFFFLGPHGDDVEIQASLRPELRSRADHESPGEIQPHERQFGGEEDPKVTHFQPKESRVQTHDGSFSY